MYDDESLGLEPGDRPTKKLNVQHINGPTAANMKRVEDLVELYRTGKIGGLAIATGSEDGSMDAMFLDAPANCHTTRSLYCGLHVIAKHLLATLG